MSNAVRFAGLAFFLSVSAAFAAGPGPGEQFEFLPDTEALHKRLHEGRHPQDEYDRKADTAPLAIVQVEPRFHRDALIQCRNGWVLLEFVVTETGEVENVEIVAQDYQKLFGRDTVAAIKRWRFQPATRNGEPVGRRATMPIVFNRPECSAVQVSEPHPDSLRGESVFPVFFSEKIAKATVLFVPVMKQLMGTPGGAYIHAQRWEQFDVIPFEFERMAKDLIVQRNAWRKAKAEESLVLEPAATLFARIEPIAIESEHEVEAFFTDASLRDLVLVYVDRAVVASGEREIGGGRMVYDFSLPGAGFHFIEFRPNDEGNEIRVVRATDVEHPRLVLFAGQD